VIGARQEWRTTLGLSLGSVILALALSLGIMALYNKPTGAALEAMVSGALGDRAAIASTVSKMIPLLLVALGWIVAFSAGRINIGFEGQIVAGGIAATAVAVLVPGLPHAVHLPFAMLAAVVGGAIWAGIAAWLWARRNVNEIISTLLLNFVAIQLLAWLVSGPMQEPSRQLPESDVIPGSARWPVLVENTPLTWVVVVAVAAVVVVAILPRTVIGVELRLTGQNEEAARYAGVRTRRVATAGLVASGMFAGLAGGALALGTDVMHLLSGFSADYGFAGIIVALLARNNPIACIPAAFLFAFLLQGGHYMEATAGIPSALVLITIGLVMVLGAAAEFLIRRRRIAHAAAATSGARPVPPAAVVSPEHE
jgi:ABC-type uncharacterized transport system permease subunit